MNVRFEPHGKEHEELGSLVNLLTEVLEFPRFLVRVQLHGGRVIIGQYEDLRDGTFVVVNPWRSGSETHGWGPKEKGLIVDMGDVERLEYVSASSPAFADPEVGPGGAAAVQPELFTVDEGAEDSETGPAQPYADAYELEDEVNQGWIAVERAVISSAVEWVETPGSLQAERLRHAVAAIRAMEVLVHDLRSTDRTCR